MAQQARRELPELNEILDTIGWIYLKKNLVDSAARVLEELVEKYSARFNLSLPLRPGFGAKGR